MPKAATLKITKVGGSHAVILGRDLLNQANLAPGDELVALPVQDGVILRSKATASGAMYQALLDDMESRSDVYRRLAQ